MQHCHEDMSNQRGQDQRQSQAHDDAEPSVKRERKDLDLSQNSRDKSLDSRGVKLFKCARNLTQSLGREQPDRRSGTALNPVQQYVQPSRTRFYKSSLVATGNNQYLPIQPEFELAEKP